ncbi:hypothetical protein AB0E01_42430 [Nocardia vinacea]|uniref:hypothetical protein n=1 Tax=Nocardia vinacea TaxID=96468 RepID=UPI0033DDBD03
MEVVVAFDEADDIGAGILTQRHRNTISEDGVHGLQGGSDEIHRRVDTFDQLSVLMH